MESAACEFCGEGRATVYCRADSARLCLPCDRHVHSANALAQRHARTLLCHACNTRPAGVRCPACHSSLCQACDLEKHDPASGAGMHKRHAFECFTGCPSATELATLWACEDSDPQKHARAVLGATMSGPGPPLPLKVSEHLYSNPLNSYELLKNIHSWNRSCTY